MLVLAERRHYNYTAFRGCGWVCRCPDVQNGCSLRGGQSIAVHADFKGGCPEPCNDKQAFLTQAQDAYMVHYNYARSKTVHLYVKKGTISQTNGSEALKLNISNSLRGRRLLDAASSSASSS